MCSSFAARGLMGTVCFWGLLPILKNWFVLIKDFLGEESLHIHSNNRAVLFFNIREPMPRPPYFLSRITTP